MTAAGGVTNRLTVTRTVTWRRFVRHVYRHIHDGLFLLTVIFHFRNFSRDVIVASCRRFRTMRDTCAHPCRISVVCLSPSPLRFTSMYLYPQTKEEGNGFNFIFLHFFIFLFQFFFEKPFFYYISIHIFYFFSSISLFFLSLSHLLYGITAHSS